MIKSIGFLLSHGKTKQLEGAKSGITKKLRFKNVAFVSNDVTSSYINDVGYKEIHYGYMTLETSNVMG